MTTTRWKPRGRIGLRPRRKASDDPVRDDAQPEFRTLDETPSHRSPGFDEAADQHRAADDELAALADEIGTRRDLLDSAADRPAESTRRPSAANPRPDRQATTDRDADQLPAKPGDNSPRRLSANSSSDRRERATDSVPVPEAVSHDRVSDASTNRHKTATSEGELFPSEIAGRPSAATTNVRRLPLATDDAELPRSEANSDHASRRSPANPNGAHHATPSADAEPHRPEANSDHASHRSPANTQADRHGAATGNTRPRRAKASGQRSRPNTSALSREPATDSAEQPLRESSNKPSRHSTAKPTHAPSDTDLLPSQPANYRAAEARQPRAATDPAAEPSHRQPRLTSAAAPTKHPAPPSVADNRPNPEDRATRRREIGGHAAWYLAAGVVTTGLQAVLFLAFRPEIGAQWANLAALAITTVGNTEFHRRVTFANRSSRAGKRHLQDLVTFAFYAGYGSVVLAALDAVVPHPSAGQQTAVLLAASFVGGVVRFAVLRWWVFARARRADAAQDHQR